jgi:hypothetical protein
MRTPSSVRGQPCPDRRRLTATMGMGMGMGMTYNGYEGAK